MEFLVQVLIVFGVMAGHGTILWLCYSKVNCPDAHKAAKMLDAVNKNWYTRINKATLNMHSQSLCILGQVYGSYGNGLHVIGFNNAAKYAVAFSSGSYRESWIKEINKRGGS